MPTLYVTEQNALIRKTGDRLVLEKDDVVLMEIPCMKLDTVMLYGNVQFTTQAVAEMLDHGIELALFTSRGRLRGQLTPPKAKNVILRMRQYELARDADFSLELSREIVVSKIESSVAFLRRFGANHPEVLESADLGEVAKMAEAAMGAESLESLRGFEGTAAARYFSLLPELVPTDFRFSGRNRRPPRDPVNALLSFGYVIVGNELQSLLDGMGYDPYIGFYHQLDYGRPSLALDLLEEFRSALVDRFTVKLLNQRVLKLEDFENHPQRGVRLARDGLKRYFAAYEKEVAAPLLSEDGESEPFRELFRRQAQRLAKALVEGEAYEGYRLPC